jgi:general stress protein 26
MVVYMRTSLTDLANVAAVARPIVERVIWCTVTTVGADGVPRSRLMHPVWWWDGSPGALVTARPTPLKVRHLAANPRVTCFYWDPAHDTVAIDATARWLDDAERADAWEAVKAVPSPVGFDPAMIWPDGPASPGCAMLRFTADRIVATPAGQPGVRWPR